MMRYSKRVVCVIALIVCMVSVKCYSEGKGTLNIGALYNGLFSNNYTNGLGTSVGFEYRPAIIKNVSLSLRYKYVYSHFDDGSKIIIGGDGTINPYNRNPRLSYNLHTQQIGIVPKYYYELMDGVEIFIENEFNYVVVTGDVKYLLDVNEERNIKSYIPFTYSALVGFEIEKERVHYGFSLGYTTLNFKDKVAKNKPPNYTACISRLETGALMNFYFKFPLFKC